jgi:hypothetical protein
LQQRLAHSPAQMLQGGVAHAWRPLNRQPLPTHLFAGRGAQPAAAWLAAAAAAAARPPGHPCPAAAAPP